MAGAQRRQGSFAAWTMVVFACAGLVLSGCKSGGGNAGRHYLTSATHTSGNSHPTIAGIPGASAATGQPYTFSPVAGDADGDALGFTITNRPAWAQFDTATGRLSGTPTARDIGAFDEIRISVSDGKSAVTLPAFSIRVAAANSLSNAATLSWQPPMENEDGSALMDLAGYRIKYGTRADALTQTITIPNPGLTRYVITDLPPGTYYFALQAYNHAGAESDLSGVASKTIG
jgi:hypothetical protein